VERVKPARSRTRQRAWSLVFGVSQVEIRFPLLYLISSISFLTHSISHIQARVELLIPKIKMQRSLSIQPAYLVIFIEHYPNHFSSKEVVIAYIER